MSTYILEQEILKIKFIIVPRQVISHNKTSHEQIRKYFDSFPLYSSKYLAYKDWCKVQDLQLEKKLTKDYIEECQEIKSKFNSKRKIFNWEHLKNLIL